MAMVKSNRRVLVIMFEVILIKNNSRNQDEITHTNISIEILQCVTAKYTLFCEMIYDDGLWSYVCTEIAYMSTNLSLAESKQLKKKKKNRYTR